MKYRKLGRTGLSVSTICLGTMQFGWTAVEQEAHAILNRAVESGCNFIDTADIYSSWVEGNRGGESETVIGNWLVSGSVRRQDVIIASKVRGKMGDGANDEGLSRQHIFNAIDDSLRRLQTEYIDLYQLHWPDLETPLEETLTALNDLVRMGKVRYIGCSNYPAWLMMKALSISDQNGLARFDSAQPHYNLVHREEFERELQPLCLDQGVGVIPYSPLAGGFLTGKYRRDGNVPNTPRAERIYSKYMNDAGFAAIDRLEIAAEERGATIAQMALAWVLGNTAVSSVIIGANSITQLDETMQAADIELSDAEMGMLV